MEQSRSRKRKHIGEDLHSARAHEEKLRRRREAYHARKQKDRINANITVHHRSRANGIVFREPTQVGAPTCSGLPESSNSDMGKQKIIVDDLDNSESEDEAIIDMLPPEQRNTDHLNTDHRGSVCLQIFTGVHGGRTRTNLQSKRPLAINTSFESLPSEVFILPSAASCEYCHAERFHRESKGFCCSEGKVRLALSEPPQQLVHLLTSADEDSISFRTFIRTYNNLFAFTSLGVSYDKDLCRRNDGVYTFRVQGQIYHYINQLLPQNSPPSFLQLYFYDTEHELENRLNQSDKLRPSVVKLIMEMLSFNPYSVFFRSLAQCPNLETQKILIKCAPSLDQRVYNAPTVSQVAAIWVEDNDNDAANYRDIHVQSSNGEKHKVNYFYSCYDPLQYPILFPFGEVGWHSLIKRVHPDNRDSLCAGENLTDPRNVNSVDDLFAIESDVLDDAMTHKRTNVSAREYYCYKLQIRAHDKSLLLRSGRLLQQFVIDMYIKLESSRLDYFRSHQKKIRSELYQGVVDSLARGQTHGKDVGHRIILPGSFIGGPRDMHKRFADAMALVQKLGKPDLFITMTCNPNWPEIKKHLAKGEEAQNRPDLVARAFRARLEELKNDIVKKNIFGPVAGYVYVIEFQKRGLPHAHFLIILQKKAKIVTPESYDAYVSAEIPPKTVPHLRSAVKKHMMHGPCGSLKPNNVCMKNGACKHHYPKSFCEKTTQGKDSFPIYRKRENGDTVKVRGHHLDNRWVIPYNPYLLAKYDCHINVEICSTIKAVKYLYKYIYKGHDRITFEVVSEELNQDYDEISRFQNGRWISPPEAMWRIYGFLMNEMSPSVLALQLHLEHKQPVSFKDSDNLASVAKNQFLKKTMLTEFFAMNARCADSRDLLYKEFPEHYVWSKKDRLWSPREKGLTIGRIVTANPAEGERYYLRLLLNHVRGPTSFEDLQTVNGVLTKSFREATLLLGLIDTDNTLEDCLKEASFFSMPSTLRRLFATILVYCNPSNPKKLWIQFEDQMSEDFLRATNNARTSVRSQVLRSIGSTLESMGRKIDDFHLVDRSILLGDQEHVSREMADELALEVTAADLESVDLLNFEQKHAFNSIMSKINNNESGAFFIDGPGGTGKTFLYRALLATVRSMNYVALATATSGVAASILPGGRTAHSRFKIPIDADQQLNCNVSKQSGLAELLYAAKLIIWDEASMAKRHAIEAFDNMLKDLMDSELLFGGKVVVFGGDFRQVLPVVPKGTLEQTKDASLVKSKLWSQLIVITLSQNMRARLDVSFTDYLLRVGNGTEPTVKDDNIRIPDHILIPYENDETSLNTLIDFVFPNICAYDVANNVMINKAILTPKNDFVDELNDILIKKFPGDQMVYKSRDENIGNENYMLEEDFFNSLTPNGYPPHELVLKIGSPIILLRNIDPSKGLSNGTRLTCCRFERNVIDAEISTGHHKGERVFIPRIPLLPNKADKYPFPFKRVQFPIRLCFTMTINKAQGQTLDTVGVYLPQPVFSHGQLYVALSRAISARCIKILIKPPINDLIPQCTANVVCKDILELAHPN